MADLDVDCFSETGNNGNIPIRDKFLGRVTISTLSTTSQSAALPKGTKYVALKTDATVEVFFKFGLDSATATADANSESLRADLNETILDHGVDGKISETRVTYIAARIAA